MSKRITVATLVGFILGIMCWLAGIYGIGNEYTDAQVLNIFVHRAVMGFVIGISALRMNWCMHGVVVGTIVGLLFNFYEYILGYPMWNILMLFGVNAAYGVLIELVTTKICNAPVQVIEAR